jgi:Tfp pilus assembly protein PilF
VKPDMIANLEALLARGEDNATLRFALGSGYLEKGDADAAIRHAEAAVALDADYSAAWKLLGQARIAVGRPDAAADAYERGIAVAERRGDQQAAKEMRVFLKRLRRAAPAPDTTPKANS